MQAEITLGDTIVPVYPARWAYLANRVGKAVQAVAASGEGLTADSLLDFAGGGAYEVLVALIPNLEKRLTREDFMGEDTSPTVPEIREALRVALAVNEIDDLPSLLGKAIGPAGVAFARASILEQMVASSDSPNSPSPSGDSPSTTSSQTPPISTESTDSPSPASAG